MGNKQNSIPLKESNLKTTYYQSEAKAVILLMLSKEDKEKFKNELVKKTNSSIKLIDNENLEKKLKEEKAVNKRIILITTGTDGKNKKEYISNNNLIYRTIIYCYRVDDHKNWAKEFPKIVNVENTPDGFFDDVLNLCANINNEENRLASESFNFISKKDFVLNNKKIIFENFFLFLGLEKIYTENNSNSFYPEAKKNVEEIFELEICEAKKSNDIDDLELLNLAKKDFKNLSEIVDSVEEIQNFYKCNKFLFTYMNDIWINNKYQSIFSLRYFTFKLLKALELQKKSNYHKNVIPKEIFRCGKLSGTLLDKGNFDSIIDTVFYSSTFTSCYSNRKDSILAMENYHFNESNNISSDRMCLFKIIIKKDVNQESLVMRHKINKVLPFEEFCEVDELILKNNLFFLIKNNSIYNHTFDTLKSRSIFIDEITLEILNSDEIQSNFKFKINSEIHPLKEEMFEILFFLYNNKQYDLAYELLEENQNFWIQPFKYYVYDLKAKILFYQNKKEESLKCFEKALDMLEDAKENNDENKCIINNNIAIFYLKKGELEESLKILESLNNNLGNQRFMDISNCKISEETLAYMYFSLANLIFLNFKSNYKEEIDMFYNLAIENINHVEKPPLANELYSKILFNLGSVYFNKNEYEKAKDFYLKCLDSIKKLDSNSSLILYVYSMLATCSSRLNNEIDTKKYFQEALSIESKIENRNNSEYKDVLKNILSSFN